MKCPRCGADFIWGGDHDFEDYGCEGDGIVTNMSCSTKWCEASILLYLPETNNSSENTKKNGKSDSSDFQKKKKNSLSQTDKEA